MSVQIVKDYFKNKNISKEIIEFSSSSATVDLAAQAAGVEPARIAKTLSFYTKERDTAILIVTAGDTKIDNSKFKHFFSMKAKMLSPEDVETYTGHAVGGVCPFGNPSSVTTYLDVSLKRFSTVFPAAGSANSAVEVTCEELEKFAEAADWIDVCKTPSV
ncbi:MULTISPECIES: YbaK/EbsC family protein [Lachnospiraceae]|jgi:prolyl-tRNA editing enzyme YbaK/EbsC (Cys-tRNA(Pro) deacylase)|uniref:YbaK/EbsC family protein n=1 Tax=Faecalicatena acetigenes TaxID=2981790 RepID=A0ABT2T820_9FIRM|nr:MULTISPECIES: YbaK/EbsC family protein [Lachnospiraceae]MCU6746371.1 YbaK/EbsC family protein [Faecalicatena acetigenes]RGT71717.1 YbaK/EbsC family protein [Ruminococcus sp. AF18-22]SCH14984.1 Cys-tRNA(Pro)/Cys-tRNA(Cys) deacylase ybaK [uncultured Clostridium sp.]